jgi:U4/U6.U5 tri-snRNP-associated protein 2
MVVVYVWNRQVSPHDLLQEVVTASKKKFMIGKPAECIEFFSWLLNTLHAVRRPLHNP